MPLDRPPRAKAVLLILCAVAMPAITASPAIGATNGEAQVEAVIEQFVDAWNRHRIDALTKLFTEGGSFRSPAGNGAESRSEIRNLLLREHGEIFRESTLQIRVEKVGFPKPGSAVATGTYTLSGVPALFGIEVTREGTFDFRLIRRDGRWLIQSARIA